MAEKRTDALTRPQSSEAVRREPQRGPSGIGLMERFADEVDRIFDDFGIVRGRMPKWGQTWLHGPGREFDLWSPSVDVLQRNSELVVRADLPGLRKDDVKVDVTEDAITIQGERRREQEDEHGGVYRSERSYGSFERRIALPEGAMADQAKATFRDGVLEITMPVPSEHVTRGRRLEISEGAPTKK